MNRIALGIAAGSLAAIAAPAAAVEIAPAPFTSASALVETSAPTTTVAALHDRDRRYRGGRGRVYDDRGRYYEPRYYCKRDNGTTGLVIGAGVGALAGHEIAGRGDRTLGAILGGVVGGVVGREIDRGSLSCR